MARKLAKAKLKVGNTVYTVPFNPSSFTNTIAVDYAETMGAGANYPLLQFAGGRTPEIQVQFYLNARTEGHDIQKFINTLKETIPYENNKSPFNTPPKEVIFAYGWFVKKCKVVQIDYNFTMFDRNLKPIEAVVNVTLKVIPSGTVKI